MTSLQTITAKSKAKAGYYTESRERVPSVTTVLGDVLAKPALIPWANKLGLAGVDVKSYVDALADVGKLAHAMILADLKGTDPAKAGGIYNAATVDLAENCLISYYAWKKGKAIEPVLVETPIVSEEFKFGGTADFYGLVDGVTMLIDFKTGKGIWPEHWYQLSAYHHLIGQPVESFMILNIPRAESEQFEAKTKTDLRFEWLIFKHALAIYQIKKTLGK